jgi:hypothetical protein
MSKMDLVFDGKKYKLFEEKHLRNVDRYEEFDGLFVEWTKENNIKLPTLTSFKGQVIALMTDPLFENFIFDRKALDAFLAKLGTRSKDVIQIPNKTDQWGLVHKTYNKQYYHIPRPFQYIGVHIKKRTNFKNVADTETKAAMVAQTKDFLLKYYIDVPDDKWDLGHIDPQGSNAADNLIMQPPIQRAYRDRFKFDEHGLRLCPTVEEIKKNTNRYFSKEDIKSLQEYFSSL